MGGLLDRDRQTDRNVEWKLEEMKLCASMDVFKFCRLLCDLMEPKCRQLADSGRGTCMRTLQFSPFARLLLQNFSYRIFILYFPSSPSFKRSPKSRVSGTRDLYSNSSGIEHHCPLRIWILLGDNINMILTANPYGCELH